jgi:rhomboid protease GluP
MSPEADAFLCEIDRPEAVSAVHRALTEASIPFQSGLRAIEGASVLLFVPTRQLAEAKRVVAPYLFDAGAKPTPTADSDSAEDDEDSEPLPPLPPATFPWGPVQVVASVVLFHLCLVFWAGSSLASPPNFIRLGGITKAAAQEPWRVFTAMFVHVDPSHVFWNGVSFLVFAVPLIGVMGYRRTSLIYIAAGLGGGITAYAFLTPGSVVVGSSGAVAGLFGAWVVQAWQQGARDTISWRGKIRGLGIAALVLPSLISPVNSSGDPISVASHLGGLITGSLVGALISGRFESRSPDDTAVEAFLTR